MPLNTQTRSVVTIMISVAVIVTFLSTTLHSQTPPSEEPRAVAWTHHLVYSDSGDVQSIAFSPDGNLVYVHLHAPIINVWALVVHYWPEWMSGLQVLLTVVLLVCVWWIQGRPQSPGMPYCRRCNYNLSTHTVDDDSQRDRRLERAPGMRCPECGLDLNRRRPRNGRSMRRRLAVIGSVWLLHGLILASMFTLGVPRQGSLSGSVFWPSRRLAKVALNRGLGFLGSCVSLVDVVIEVDVRSGRTIRTVYIASGRSYPNICIAPDGRSFFLTGPKEREITEYRISDGQKMRTVSMPGRTVSYDVDPSIIGFSPDGRIAYVQWVDLRTAESGVSAWDLPTGETEELVRTPAYVETIKGMLPMVRGRHFLHGSSAETPIFISRPDFMEAYPTKTYKVRVHELDAGEYREFELSPLPDSTESTSLTSDGRYLIVSEQHGRQILIVDVVEGRTQAVVPVRIGDVLSFEQSDVSDDDSLLVGGFSDELGVLDLADRQWIGTLSIPAGLYGAECWISPDKRWVGAVCQRSLPTPGQVTHDLVLWDISPLVGESGQ